MAEIVSSQRDSELVQQQDLEIHVQLNDKYGTSLHIPWKTLCPKSTLFENMFESCSKKQNVQIKLKLDRPDLFFDLLRYFETNKLVGDLNHATEFVNYIGDVNYLGMQELEDLLQTKFWEAVQKLPYYNFSLPTTSEAHYVFLERFLRERKNKQLSQMQQFQLLLFVTQWGRKYGLDDQKLRDLLRSCIDVKELTFEQIQQYVEQFPNEFNLLFSARTLYERFLTRLTCRRCKKNIKWVELFIQKQDRKLKCCNAGYQNCQFEEQSVILQTK